MDRSAADVEKSSGNPLPHGTRTPAMTNAMPPTINEMKKKFLDQSDWLGLSACRPANVDFAAAGEMAKIGRHRRSTQLKDQDGRNRATNRSDQQYRTIALTGKRKRSDQEEQPSRLDTNACPSGDRSREQVNHDPPHRRLEDPDRRFYILVNDEASQGVASTDLLSLEDARELKNFDAVKEKYLDSKLEPKAKNCSARDAGGSKTEQVLQSSTRQKGQPKRSLNPDHGASDFVTREPRSEIALDSSTYLAQHSAPLKHTENHNAERVRRMTTRDSGASQSAAGMISSEPHDRQPRDVGLPTLQKLGVAVKDLDFTAENLKGKHRLRAADSADLDHGINRTWPGGSTQISKAILRPVHSTDTLEADESPARKLFRTHESRNSPISTLAPRVRFKLDETFDRQSEKVLRQGNDAPFEEDTREIDPYQFPGTRVSPHFIHMMNPHKKLQQSNSTLFSPISIDSQNAETGSHKSREGKFLHQDRFQEARKRLFTGTSLLSPTESHDSATHLPSQSCVTTPSKDVQNRLWTCDRTPTLKSGSSVNLDHERSPAFIFSRR